MRACSLKTKSDQNSKTSNGFFSFFFSIKNCSNHDRKVFHKIYLYPLSHFDAFMWYLVLCGKQKKRRKQKKTKKKERKKENWNTPKNKVEWSKQQEILSDNKWPSERSTWYYQMYSGYFQTWNLIFTCQGKIFIRSADDPVLSNYKNL